jgi:hypothetical protein
LTLNTISTNLILNSNHMQSSFWPSIVYVKTPFLKEDEQIIIQTCAQCLW